MSELPTTVRLSLTSRILIAKPMENTVIPARDSQTFTLTWSPTHAEAAYHKTVTVINMSNRNNDQVSHKLTDLHAYVTAPFNRTIPSSPPPSLPHGAPPPQPRISPSHSNTPTSTWWCTCCCRTHKDVAGAIKKRRTRRRVDPPQHVPTRPGPASAGQVRSARGIAAPSDGRAVVW